MAAQSNSPVTVSKLGYVGFETPDVERLVDYYTQTLDFVLVEGSSEGAFLTTTFDQPRGGHRKGAR